MKFKGKKSLWFYSFLGVVILGLFLFSRALPPTLVVVNARTGDIIKEISDSGFTRFKAVYTVLAPQSGWFETSHTSTGEQIKKGLTILATITGQQPPLLDARTRASLKAQVEAAKAQEDQARAQRQRLLQMLEANANQLKRMEKVLQNGAVSAQDVDVVRARSNELRSEIQSTDANLDALKHSREAAESNLHSGKSQMSSDALQLKAPHSGVLAWVYDERSRFVTLGTPLFDIATTSEMYFEMDILARESLSVRPGQWVRFPETDTTGKVRSVSPTALSKVSPLGISEQRIRVRIDFTTPTPAHWPAGLELEAGIETQKKSNVILVPLTAVWSEGSSEYLYRVENNRLKKVKVQSGIQSLTEMEITSGISTGDLVVRFPSEEMSDGQKISTGV